MVPKTSDSRMVSTRPVLASGLRSSILVPLETTISWLLGRPEKEPTMACPMLCGGETVKLMK